MYTDDVLDAKTRHNDRWPLATHKSHGMTVHASPHPIDYTSHCEEQDNAAQMLHLISTHVHNGSDAIYFAVVLLRTPSVYNV